MRQSRDAFPQDMTELKMALTMRLLVLLYTKYIAAEHIPAENVANTGKEIVNCTICIYYYGYFFA